MFIHNVQAQNTRKKIAGLCTCPAQVIVNGSRHGHEMQTSTVSYVHETSGAFTHIHVMYKKIKQAGRQVIVDFPYWTYSKLH